MTKSIAAVGSQITVSQGAQAARDANEAVRARPALPTLVGRVCVLVRRGVMLAAAYLLAGFVLPHTAADEPEFPYLARVVVDRAAVRSGPGEEYYPVMELGRHAEVEVYRHDPGGWYAVKPPEGSYSWVSAAFVQPAHDGRPTAIIRGRRVVVRVGSPLVDVPDVIQLRLNSGDQVRLLDPQPFEFNNMVWYKIAPPAGEFRWVYGRDVEPVAASLMSQTSAERSGALAASSEPLEENEGAEAVGFAPADAQFDVRTPSTAASAGRPASADEQTQDELLAWLARRRERRRRVLAAIERGEALPAEDAEPVALPEEPAEAQLAHSDEVQWALLQEEPDAALAERPAHTGRRGGQQAPSPNHAEPSRAAGRHDELAAFDASLEAWLEEEQARAHRQLRTMRLPQAGEQPTDVTAELEDMELALSAMASEPAEQWDLDPLRARAERLLVEAETALDRGRARLMLRKLARFEDVQQRHAALYGRAERPKPDHAPREPRRLDLADAESEPVRAAGRRYDGEGTLTRVVTRAAGAPPYALLDPAGEVKFYVSPAPGVNLRRYEGLRVAVIGSVGYLPEQKARHVTAKQVLPLAAEGVELSAYRLP